MPKKKPHKAARGAVRPLLWAVACAVLAALCGGCASGFLVSARDSYYSGRLQEAEAVLAANQPSARDTLLYLMEKGLVEHDLGRYRQSAATLRQASAWMDENVISASREAVSLLTTDLATAYDGEYCERLWVHAYLMMDYLILGEPESALVEAKQALAVFDEHQDSLASDVFTRALIALCFENLGEKNDAYIEYKKAARNAEDPSALDPVLFRLARALSFFDDAEKYGKNLTPEEKKKEQGPELVVFAAWGQGPRKMPASIVVPPGERISWVAYEPDRTPWGRVSAKAQAGELPVLEITTSVPGVAADSLDERKTRVIAKEAARFAAKEATARVIANNYGEAAGLLARLAFIFSGAPDTRCWETLPARLCLARVALAPGTREVTLTLTSPGGAVMGQTTLTGIQLMPNGKAFVSVRF